MSTAPLTQTQAVGKLIENADRFNGLDPRVRAVIEQDGLIRRYIDFIYPVTDAPEEFHVLSLLTVLGAVTRDRVRFTLGGMPHYLNLYTLFLAESGQRKTTAINNAVELLNIAAVHDRTLDNLMLPTEWSTEALVDAFERRRTGLFKLTEFAELLALLKSDWAARAKYVLIKAFDGEHNIRTAYRQGGGEKTIPFALASFLGAAVPEYLSGRMQEMDAVSGLFARFFFITGKRIRNYSVSADPDLTEQNALGKWLGDFSRSLPASGAAVVSFDSLKPVLRAWDGGFQSRDVDPRVIGFRTRLDEHVRKLSILLYISRTSKPGVDEQSFALAAGLVNWLYEQSSEFLIHHLSTSKFDAARQKVLLAVRAKPGILYDELLRQTRFSVRWLREILESLEGAREIRPETAPSDGRPGRPPMAWYPVEHRR
jgi:hypothetical protein